MNQASLLAAACEYPSDFERAWEAYPKRPGNPKRAAFKCYRDRQRQGFTNDLMLAGVERYAEYCRASKSDGTCYVMMARTFFGPDLHFLEDWEPPEVRPEWATLPRDDNDLWDHAKAHGLPNPGSMNYRQYRKFLEAEVERRLAGGGGP